MLNGLQLPRRRTAPAVLAPRAKKAPTLPLRPTRILSNPATYVCLGVLFVLFLFSKGSEWTKTPRRTLSGHIGGEPLDSLTSDDGMYDTLQSKAFQFPRILLDKNSMERGPDAGDTGSSSTRGQAVDLGFADFPKEAHTRGLKASEGFNPKPSKGDSATVEEREVAEVVPNLNNRSSISESNDSVNGTHHKRKSRKKKKKTKKKDKKDKKQQKERPQPASREVCSLEYNQTVVPAELPQLPGSSILFNYVETATRDKKLVGNAFGFGGHQTWAEREDSFFLNKAVSAQGSKLVHCGFVNEAESRESEPGKEQFSIAPEDKDFLTGCTAAVISALFGNFDMVHPPQRSVVTEVSRSSMCFVLFLDAASLEGVLSDGFRVTKQGYVGLWRTVLVSNLPYQDNRLNGKIPKMLAHRLLPNARYSVWVDSKLRLNIDPAFALMKFLIDPQADLAISQHYDRQCIWEEVARNKFLKKFNASVLDAQLDLYSRDGMKPFNETVAENRLLPSNVPEGSFFMRAHTPLSNLFMCLWFNEVNWFSSRDQISFAYVLHKLWRNNPGMERLKVNMFKDCHRRAMVKVLHHREEERQLALKRATLLSIGSQLGDRSLVLPHQEQ